MRINFLKKSSKKEENNWKNIIFAFVNNRNIEMIVTFDKEYLESLYTKGKSDDKKHRFQPEVIKLYKKRIDLLKRTKRIEELFLFNSLNYEVLKGDKNGVSSIRVNDKYRIEFVVSNQDAETIVYICNILELSNHYK